MTSLVPCNQGTLPFRPALTRRRIWVWIFGTKSGFFQVRDPKFAGGQLLNAAKVSSTTGFASEAVKMSALPCEDSTVNNMFPFSV